MSITPNNDASLKQLYCEIAQTHHYCKKEEERLLKLCAAGDNDAKLKLWKGNLRFAITYAKKFIHKSIPFEDLLQEAMIGLWIAVDKFDPNKPFKFLTYAAWWMRQRLSRYIAKHASIIYIPESQQFVFRKIQQIQQESEKKNEIISECDIQESNNFSKKQIEVTPNKFVSIASSIGDSNSLVEEMLADNSNLELQIETNDLRNRVQELLNQLSEADRQIIDKTFGFTGPQIHPKLLAENLGITVTQLHTKLRKILRKLKQMWKY